MKFMRLNLLSLVAMMAIISCGPASTEAEEGGTDAVMEASADIQSQISDRLDGYLEMTNNKDWNGSFDYLHPTIFDIAPKEQMVAAFEQMDASGFTILVESSEITEYQNVVSWEGNKYTKFTYDCDMLINLGGDSFTDPMIVEMMNQQMQQQYGEDKVVFDSTSNSFDVDAIREVWAITGADNKWYFVEENPQLYLVLDQIVPDTVQALMGM